MIENNKRIAKNSAYLYIRMLFALVVNLYTSRVILQVMGVEDYGIYSIIGGVVSMFGFFNSAMTNASQRFFSFELGRKDFDKLRRTFSASLSIHLFIALIILFFSETIGLWFVNNKLNFPIDRVVAVNVLYQLTIITFLIGIVQVPYRSSLIANEKFNVFAVLSILEIFFKLFAVIGLIYISVDKIIAYGALLALVALMMLFLNYYYCKKKFNECQFNFLYDKELYGSLLGYTSWSLIGNFAAVAYNEGVNVLLNIFFGPIVNAARGIAFQVQGAVNSFILNAQMAINPQIIKSYAEDNKGYMFNLIFMSSKYSCFLLLIISMPIFLNTDYILHLWLGQVPEYSEIFVKLILINIIIDGISNPLMIAAQANGDIKRYQIIVGSTVLLNLPISYGLLNFEYPPETTMYVSICLAFISLFLRLIELKRMIYLEVFSFLRYVLFRIILVTVVIYVLVFLFEKFFISDIYKLFFSFIISLFSICICGLSRKDFIFIKSFISK